MKALFFLSPINPVMFCNFKPEISTTEAGNSIFLNETGAAPYDYALMAKVWNGLSKGAQFFNTHAPKNISQIYVAGKRGATKFQYHFTHNSIYFPQNARAQDLYEDVLLTQYGHKVLQELYGSHGYNEAACACTNIRSDRCAWYKGWATFYALAVKDSPQYVSSNRGRPFDYDNYGERGIHTSVRGDRRINLQTNDTHNVTAALWDIYKKGISMSDMLMAIQEMRTQHTAETARDFYRVLRPKIEGSIISHTDRIMEQRKFMGTCE